MPEIAANNCDQTLLANYTLSNNRDPPCFSVCRRSWATFIHTNKIFKKSIQAIAFPNCVCYESIRLFYYSFRELRGEVLENLPKIRKISLIRPRAVRDAPG